MKAVCIFFGLSLLFQFELNAGEYKEEVEKLRNWLFRNREHTAGLPYSHVGDMRFENWSITYDSAVTALAYVAAGNADDARNILDFYINTPAVWRLGGIIEAVNTSKSSLGVDWSVRTGSNLWMAIAGYHLYKSSGDEKYFELSLRIADFILSLQNTEEGDINFGGIVLGPEGDSRFSGDQHIGYEPSLPGFHEIYATEHNIGAYALFNMLYGETGDYSFRQARDRVLDWIGSIAYNRDEQRFNRGFNDSGIDTAVATDVQSWGITALGAEIIDSFEGSPTVKITEFIEKNCLSKTSFVKPDGSVVEVKGADFVDRVTAGELGREPLVSPEWTFQLINAYGRLETDFERQSDKARDSEYREKKEKLTEEMLKLAIEQNDSLTYPYATKADALIGHEYRTPGENNFSTIGVSYGILALLAYEPLVPAVQ